MRLVLLGKSNPCSSDSDGDGLNDGRVSLKMEILLHRKIQILIMQMNRWDYGMRILTNRK